MVDPTHSRSRLAASPTPQREVSIVTSVGRARNCTKGKVKWPGNSGKLSADDCTTFDVKFSALDQSFARHTGDIVSTARARASGLAIFSISDLIGTRLFLIQIKKATHRTLVASLALGCGFSGAAAQPRNDNLFTAAGFIVKYATTPEKSAILRSLPPNKLVKRAKDGKLYYVYADAYRCNCAYIGTPEAYTMYQNGGDTLNLPGNGRRPNNLKMIESDDDADMGPNMDAILDPSF